MSQKLIKVINIILIPVKICLVLCMTYGVYSYFNKVFINENVDYGVSFHSLPDNSMYVLVLGSSHAQYSFVPPMFYEDTGLRSYVMGSACQPLEVSYEMLKEGLKTQSPQLVILEVYTAMPLRKVCEADVCYVAAQYLMRDEEKYNTINYLPEEKAETYRNDFMNYHNNWKYADTLDKWKINNVFIKDEANIDPYFGYVYQDAIFPIENHWRGATFESSVDVRLDELDLVSLNNIYNLCKEKGIELLLYKTPIDGMDIENQSYLHKVWEWADEKSVPYIDFFQIQDKLDYWMCVYSDSYHNFINGAGVVTKEISDYVNENYHFTITNNKLDERYNKSAVSLDIKNIQYEYNVYKCFSRMKNEDMIKLIKYDKSRTIMQDRLRDSIIELGFESFDVNDNYYAIYYDGKLLESNENINEVINNHEIIINNEGIYVDGEPMPCEGYLTFTLFNNDMTQNTSFSVDFNDYPWRYGYDFYYKK